MLINGKRALAYIVTIDEIKPIPNYDRVEHARTNGWWVIISKNDCLKVGDKCVYFEIDSRVPADDDRFAFLEKRDFKVRTLRMCKVLSQGLLMPVSVFGFESLPVGTDVTDKLGITYAVDEDNARKAESNKQAKYMGMYTRHKRLFKTRLFKWIMRHEHGREFLFKIFGKKTDVPLSFPDFVSKTDEERIENLPYKLGTDEEYILTEKLDGTSATYVLSRNGKKYDFAVCSRNLRLPHPKDGDPNMDVYWEMAYKYNIENVLTEILKNNPGKNWVCLQGEIIGPGIQKNPLDMSDHTLNLFNLIVDGERWPTDAGCIFAQSRGIPWVPILGCDTLPNTMDDMKAQADGKSALNENKLREGIVYRSLDGKDSFKNVSNEYLLHQGKLKPKKVPANE